MKKTGFSLAEVLITLGIIGIVSAMVIPTLIANYRAVKNVTQFKKAVSTLSQVAVGGLALTGINFKDSVDSCSTNGAKDTSDSILSLCALLNDSLAGQAYVPERLEVRRAAGRQKQGQKKREQETEQASGDRSHNRALQSLIS